jgi:hypothetical protein
MTGVSNLRLPNNDGIRPNTSQYDNVLHGKDYHIFQEAVLHDFEAMVE